MTDKERDFVFSVINPDKRLEIEEEWADISKVREVPQWEIDLSFIRAAYLEKFSKHFPFEYIQDLPTSEAEEIILQCITEGKEYEIPEGLEWPDVIVA